MRTVTNLPNVYDTVRTAVEKSRKPIEIEDVKLHFQDAPQNAVERALLRELRLGRLELTPRGITIRETEKRSA